jgi:hypothetical protein
VHGQIALPAHDVHLGVQSGAHKGLERRLEQESREIRLVRLLQAAIHLEDPRHRQLQSAACVEAGGARVALRGLLRPRGFRMQLWPLDGQEAEVEGGSGHDQALLSVA